jgi:hypothetical protein
METVEIGGRTLHFLTSRKLPPNSAALVNSLTGKVEVLLTNLGEFTHRPRGATIARSRALLRWRVACHRARKGLARSFPVTTGFGLAPVNGGIRRRLNPSL